MSGTGEASSPSGLLFVTCVTERLANPLAGTDECHPSWVGRATVSVSRVPMGRRYRLSGSCAGSGIGGRDRSSGYRCAERAVGLELLDVVELIARRVVREQRPRLLVRDEVGRRRGVVHEHLF